MMGQSPKVNSANADCQMTFPLVLSSSFLKLPNIQMSKSSLILPNEPAEYPVGIEFGEGRVRSNGSIWPGTRVVYRSAPI